MDDSTAAVPPTQSGERGVSGVDSAPLLRGCHDTEPSSSSSSAEPHRPPLVGSVRGYHVLMIWSGIFCMYLIRTCVSDTIVSMQKELGWTGQQKGLYLASFFVGYIMLQILGGMLARRFGGKIVLLLGVLWPMVLTLVTPAVARRFPFSVSFVLRVLLGAGESVTYPAIMFLLSQWSPTLERARHAAFAYSGSQWGVVGSMFVSPAMESAFDWTAPFYLFGGLGLLWCATFYRFAADSPSSHPTISASERKYIEDCHLVKACPLSGRVSTEPLCFSWLVWRTMLLDRRMWAICAANFCQNWALYVLISWLPSYFKDRWGVDVKEHPLQSGWLSGAPFFFSILAIPLVSVLADRMLRGGWSRFSVRNAMMIAACVVPAFFLVMLAYEDRSKLLSWALLVCAVVTTSPQYSGYVPYTMEVAGNRDATLYTSVSNTFGTIPGIVGVSATGFILDSSGNDYATVWLAGAGVLGFGLVSWLLLARPASDEKPPATVAPSHA